MNALKDNNIQAV